MASKVGGCVNQFGYDVPSSKFVTVEWNFLKSILENLDEKYDRIRFSSYPFLIPGFGSHTFLLTLNSIKNSYTEIGIEGLDSSNLGKIKVYIENDKKKQFFTNYIDSTMNFKLKNILRTDVLLHSLNLMFNSWSFCIKFEIDKMDKIDKNELHNEVTYKFQVLDQLETLLNNKEFSDIKFAVNEKIIYAHKLILVTRSSVFLAMFKHPTKEAMEHVIEITDIKYEVLLETLRFIYTGKVNEIEKYSKELLASADKYDLQGLKEMSTAHLFENLSIDNVMEYLYLADLHNLQQLRKKAIQFIIWNAKTMVDRPDFNLLVDLHKDLVLEVIRTALLQTVIN